MNGKCVERICNSFWIQIRKYSYTKHVVIILILMGAIDKAPSDPQYNRAPWVRGTPVFRKD